MTPALPFRLSLFAASLLALGACNTTGDDYYDGSGHRGYGRGPGYERGAQVYREAPPPPRRSDWNNSGWSNQGWANQPRDTRYARNGRCDDPRYNTSNGGRAAPGTDEWDCSRHGDGLK